MNEPGPPPARRRLRLVALAVTAVCMLALAAGTFALSYPGARATAVNAGVDASLARIYPGIFDAVLLVACAAALTLRRAWRVYAWLVMLVVIGTVAAADTVHAMAIGLPKRPMEATVAVVPWVALLVGLTLLDALVRQGRPGRKAGLPGPARPVTAADHRNGALPSHGATTVPLNALLTHRPAAPMAGSSPATHPAAHPTQPTQPGQPARPPASKPPPRPAVQPALHPTAQTIAPPAGPTSAQPVPQTAAKPTVADTAKPAVQDAKPEQAQPAKPAVQDAKPEQAQPAKPAADPSATLPGPSPPQPGGRDEPSDADAEPSEPSAFFGRLRRSLSPSGKAAKDGKQPPAEPPPGKPAPSQPQPSEPQPSQPPPSEPPASKEPATESPKAESGS